MSNVISICGSLRKGSYNRMVMNLLPGLAPAGMAINEAPTFADFPLYKGIETRNKDRRGGRRSSRAGNTNSTASEGRSVGSTGEVDRS